MSGAEASAPAERAYHRVVTGNRPPYGRRIGRVSIYRAHELRDLVPPFARLRDDFAARRAVSAEDENLQGF